MRAGGAFEAQAMPPQEHHYAAGQAAAAGWKSPVPYLFGGLAAMLGLIAFALLILACSYWKLSGYLDTTAGESDGAADDEKPSKEAKSEYLNTVLVIMPGDEKPTQLATPATSRASSFGDGSQGSCSCGGGDGGEGGRREKEVELGHVQVGGVGSAGVGAGDQSTTTSTSTTS